jgi:hypothetical protein
VIRKDNEKYFMIMIAKNSQNFDDDQFEVPSPEHMRIQKIEADEKKKEEQK